MAESQVPYSYDAGTVSALKASLSEPRFAKYLLKASGNEAYAFALYLYNARLAKSFLFPLGVTEVTMRNAVDDVLVQKFGADWHKENKFRDKVLTAESLSTLDKAIERARHDDRGKIIAELTFDFWSNLFRKEYADFWRTKANIAFPELQRGEGRREIQTLAREINRLRNRVAHHEPILDMNVPDLHSKMIKLTRLRCPATSDWMRHHSTINQVMRTRPNLAGSAPVTLKSRSDTNFFSVSTNASLIELTSRDAQNSVAIVCLENGKVAGAFTHQQLAKYINRKATELTGMIDLNEHSIADVVSDPEIAQGYKLVAAETSFIDTIDELKKPKTRIIVAMDPADNIPVGVILRAHRRY